MDSSSGPATSFSMRGAFKEAQPRILYVLNKVPVSLGPALTLGALRHPILTPFPTGRLWLWEGWHCWSVGISSTVAVLSS